MENICNSLVLYTLSVLQYYTYDETNIKHYNKKVDYIKAERLLKPFLYTVHVLHRLNEQSGQAIFKYICMHPMLRVDVGSSYF